VRSLEPAAVDPERTPALVLGGPVHTALSVIRALANEGIPQFTVGAGTSYVSYSRWHRRLSGQLTNDPTPELLPTFLEGLPFERMVLIPCSDTWIAAVARLRPSLATRFLASMGPLEGVNICLDKGRLADALAKLALPHPRTICIKAPDDLRTLWDSTFRDPFLKPRDSLASQALYGEKAFLIKTRDEAITRVRDAARTGLEYVLQEYVPGPARSHYSVDGFVDRAGIVCALFARRRERESAGLFVNASCMVSIPLAEAKAMVHTLDRLLPALRYRGIFNAQFKYDERDRLFKLLEVNPRVWGGISLPVSCGVNLVSMAYQDALGLPVERVADYPVGRYWVYASRDLVVSWRLFREGRLTVGEWIRTRAGAVQALFRWDDPLPAIVAFLQMSWRGIRRRLRVSL
jgi:D-aspartate ligase